MEHKIKRFNLLDWLILTILAAAIALFGFFVWRREQTTLPEVPIVCVLRLPVSDQPLEIRVGDAVRNENGTVRFGEVTEISNRPYHTLCLRNGEPVYVGVDGMKETELTVRMLARRGIDYRVGEIRVSAGEIGNYRIGGAFATGVTTVTVREVTP